MTAQSFVRRQLRTTLALPNGANFAGEAGGVIAVENMRTIVNVQAAGGPAWSHAKVQVFGLKQSIMNSLTRLSWDPRGLDRCTISIEANSGDGWQNVFVGEIIEGGPDYSGAPDAALILEATSVYFEALNPAVPSSYPQNTSVATIVSNIAKAMGRAFENNGVTTQLPPTYLPNTYPEQLRAVARAAGIDVYDESNVIAITPRGQPRQTALVNLNASSGLIGYPTLDNTGIRSLTCLYNPAIRFGGQVHVECDVPGAVGDWYVVSLDHMLESERPGGAWFSTMRCSKSGEALPLLS